MIIVDYSGIALASIIINKTLTLLQLRTAKHKALEITALSLPQIAKIPVLHTVRHDQLTHECSVVFVRSFKLIEL